MAEAVCRTKRTIDTCPEDNAFLQTFGEDLELLLGCVEEAFETNPQTLLSPQLRRLIRDKGRQVKSRWGPLKHHICADKLGGALEPWESPR